MKSTFKPFLSFITAILFCAQLNAQFNFNGWTSGATTGTISNGTCNMNVNVSGSSWNTPTVTGPRYDDPGVSYSPTTGTGLALDQNWANTSSSTVVTLSFPTPISNPSFILYDINRNNPCTPFCSNAWTDEVTVQSNTGTLIATPQVAGEQTVTNVNATTKTIIGNLICNATGGYVTISITGNISSITITYRSGAIVDRAPTGAPLCATPIPTACLTGRVTCADPARQYITIGSISGSCISALPVEFGDFYYQCNENELTLNWFTQSELNNEKFEILESEDGVNFHVIHEEKGAGTTQMVQFYNYEGLKRESVNKYYKLRQIDFDGAIKDLKTIFIPSNCLRNEEDYILYPNPTTDEFFIINNSYLNDENVTEINVFNLEGKLIYNTAIESSFEKTNINSSNWSKGIYLVEIKNNKTIHINKIEKK